EKYLRQCLDSIIDQTLEEIEIILIDDGSTDSSGSICDEYAAMDNRIVLIHKENAGLGAAYNTGLEIAKGEYIGFVESDDWVELNMFEELYNKAREF
ncbi:TPA: glycosyltransferase, partial [Campylobacter coli]|nr:glycosyltransferase [Campylobacter coli]